jgi:hypothetical protein
MNVAGRFGGFGATELFEEVRDVAGDLLLIGGAIGTDSDSPPT